MKIELISCLNDNYSYLIIEKETNTVSIVDPSEFNACDKIIKKIRLYFKYSSSRRSCRRKYTTEKKI